MTGSRAYCCPSGGEGRTDDVSGCGVVHLNEFEHPGVIAGSFAPCFAKRAVPGRSSSPRRPLLPKHVWAIRVWLELSGNLRDLALFNLAIDSKLRGCDLVRLKVSGLVVGGVVRERVTITQSKTRHPVQFEVGDLARKVICGSLFCRCLAEVKIVIESWRRHHWRMRPHFTLGYLHPAAEVVSWSAAPSRGASPARPNAEARPVMHQR
jgi:hypothetical protein